MDGEPKYANPAAWARPVIGTSGENPLVVEGYFDLIVFEQLDIPCLCTLTSEPSSAQIVALKRFDRLHILFDSDQSGKHNACKLGRTLYPQAKVVKLPQIDSASLVKDPNDLWLAVGDERQFRATITKARQNAIDLFHQGINRIKTLSAATDVPAALNREVVPLIGNLRVGQQNAYVDIIANELKSCGISKKAIKQALKLFSEETRPNGHETSSYPLTQATKLFHS